MLNVPFQRRNSTRDSQALGGGPHATQCLGQQHIPGEGLCYIFADGSRCPVVIDGERVNPLWGTTKAGKARKRLAQACLWVILENDGPRC